MKIVPDKNIFMTKYFNFPLDAKTKNIIIAVSGYESRSTEFIKRYLNNLHNKDFEHLILGFDNYKDLHSRHENDLWYINNKFEIEEIKISEVQKLKDLLLNKIRSIISNEYTKINIHVDYSCMPRNWYCNIPKYLLQCNGVTIDLIMWYTQGIYSDTEYPTAGISDFSRFSGYPSLNPFKRHHIFSLGFDNIRTYAIYRVLDPDSLLCVIAKRNKYLQKVYDDNKEIISQADFVINLPINDFVVSFSRIIEIIKSLPKNHDVILVPDGPKPFILAFSLIPEFIDQMGITCLHVARRHVADIQPTNVLPDLSEEIIGVKLINY